MSAEPEPPPLCDGDPLARALARLRPVAAGVDTPKLLFQAGQAGRERAVAFWRRAFLVQAVVLVAVGGLGLLAYLRPDAAPAPSVPERIVYVERAPQEPEVAPLPRPVPESPPYPPLTPTGPDPQSLTEYLRIRHEVLTAGLGLLPESKPRPTSPVSPAEFERSLDLPPGVLAVPHWQPQNPKSQPEPPPIPD